MITILLVDDHVLFREGLAVMLNSQSDISVVGEAGSVPEAISLCKTLRPDIVLMDYSLPNGTGVDAMRAILSDWPEARIIFLTMHEDAHIILSVIRSGAKGYMLKYEQIAKLLSYIKGVMRGEAAISPVLAGRLFTEISQPASSNTDRISSLDLSTREAEVMEHLATGASNREIAQQLVIAENTVRKHVSNILQKLNLKTRRDAVKLVHNGVRPLPSRLTIDHPSRR